jgi:reprolysin-like metallo-peptidase family M12B
LYVPVQGNPGNNNDFLLLRLTVHVMQKTDGTGNFQDTPEDREILLNLFNGWVNAKLGGYEEPVYGGQNFPNQLPYGSKLRVELLEEDIHFWQDDLGWNDSGPGDPDICGASTYVWDEYGLDKECKFNVFLVEGFNNPAIWWSGCGPGYYSQNLFDNYFAIYNHVYNDYQNSTDLPGTKDIVSSGLAHEIGHCFGLGHTWAWECNQCDVFPDIYCPESGPGWCDPNVDPGCSNNLMGRARNKNWFSPLQFGHMRKLFLGSFRSGHLKVDYDANKTITLDGGDHTWEFARVSYGDIILENGAKLTIKCKVIMAPGSRIIVERGTSLFVDGGYITSARGCTGDYWEGIIVKGSKTNTQYYVPGVLKQGFAWLYNNTVIEHANIGVRLQDFADPNSTGGILWAFDVTFANCKNAMVDIRDYQNYNPYLGSALTGNSTRFWRCTFIIDDGYSGDFVANFRNVVYLKNVSGIDFHECNFRNAYPGNLMPANKQFAGYRKHAIRAMDAEFSVDGKCTLKIDGHCQQWEYSEFKGFARAISTGNKGGARPFRVTGSKFHDNLMGIYAARVNNLYVVDNIFEVGSDLPVEQPQYGDAASRGIEMYHCTGYTIEENTLSPYNGFGTTNPVGVLTIFSGNAPNEVRKNTFNGLYSANLSNGDNRGIDGQGLVYLCNENTANQYDFAVPLENGTGQGIAEFQGNVQLSAGNTFSPSPQQQETHFQNKGAPITYFWQTTPNAEPDDNYITPLTVIKILAAINQCPSRLDGDGILSEPEIQQFESDFQISTEVSVRIYAANMLIRHYLTDTVQQDLNAVRTWLSNKGDLQSHFSIVDTWLQESRPDSAQQALNAIPLQFVLSGEEQTEYNHFSTLKNLQISALQAGQTTEQMVDANEATLVQIAVAGDFYASVQSQILLNNEKGYSYEPPVILPAGGGQQGLTLPPGSGQGNIAPFEEINSIEAIPNPAKNNTVFHYRFGEEVLNAKLFVKTMDGRVVWQSGLVDRAGNVTWDFGSVAGGVYLYSLLLDGKTVGADKLVIVR